MGQNNEYSSINQKVIYVKVLLYGLGEECERWERKHKKNEVECENSYHRLAEESAAPRVLLYIAFYAIYGACSV